MNTYQQALLDSLQEELDKMIEIVEKGVMLKTLLDKGDEILDKESIEVRALYKGYMGEAKAYIDMALRVHTDLAESMTNLIQGVKEADEEKGIGELLLKNLMETYQLIFQTADFAKKEYIKNMNKIKEYVEEKV